MVITQGDVWWADLGDPIGSAPAFRRPLVIIQSESFNRSRLATVVCVALTSQIRWADGPGNVLLKARSTGLDRDSVANVTQIVTLDRTALDERAGQVSKHELDRIISGVCRLLGRLDTGND